MTTTTLIEKTTDEMEVIDTTISGDPESAQRAGERIARKYRAQGHACECIGVVEARKSLEYREELDYNVKTNAWGDGCGVWQRATRARFIETTVYHPVIFPKSIQEEE